MKKIFFYLLLSLPYFALFAQNIQPFQNPQSKKWGFKTAKSVAIEPMYEEVKPFYKDYACVKTAKGWGIIFQMQKKYVIEPQFLAIYVLDDYSLWVQNQQKMWGIMNFNGTWVQPCQYQGLAFWDKPEQSLYEKPLPTWDTIIFEQNNLFGLMTRRGQVLKMLPYNYIGSFEGTNFVAVCMLDAEGVGIKWGVIDKTGQEIIPCIYDDLGNRWGDWFIQLKNRRLKSPTIFVKLGDSCGYYNFNSEIITPFQPCK